MRLEPIQTFGLVFKMTVKLGFEGGVEDLFELTGRLQAHRKQVTAK